MTTLLQKDISFVIDDEYKVAFDTLKEKLTSIPILQSPNWNFPFEIMCVASEFPLGAVLGQRVDKKLHTIYYASRTLNLNQANY